MFLYSVCTPVAVKYVDGDSVYLGLLTVHNKLCRGPGDFEVEIGWISFTILFTYTWGNKDFFFLFAAQLFLIIEYQPPIKRVIGCASLIWLIICIISSHSGDSDGAVSVLYLYNAWTVLVLHTEYYSSSKGSKPSKLNVDLLLYSTYFIPGGVYRERVLRINVRLNSAILRSSIRSTSSAHSQLPRMYDRYIPDLQNTSEQIIRTLNKRSEAIRCAFEGFVSPLMVH